MGHATGAFLKPIELGLLLGGEDGTQIGLGGLPGFAQLRLLLLRRQRGILTNRFRAGRTLGPLGLELLLLFGGETQTSSEPGSIGTATLGLLAKLRPIGRGGRRRRRCGRFGEGGKRGGEHQRGDGEAESFHE